MRSMDLDDDDELVRLRSAVLDGMRSFMAEAGVDYTDHSVRECERILNEHLVTQSRAPDRDAALESVRKTVEALNALNASCAYQLIETDQRECICAFIIRAGALTGFNSQDEDVTEPWREW